MVVGGYDEDVVDGSINWIPTSGVVHVQVPMDGVIVNGFTIQKSDNTPMQAIIDV
jgi:Eukaryotic aspartyl protease